MSCALKMHCRTKTEHKADLLQEKDKLEQTYPASCYPHDKFCLYKAQFAGTFLTCGCPQALAHFLAGSILKLLGILRCCPCGLHTLSVRNSLSLFSLLILVSPLSFCS